MRIQDSARILIVDDNLDNQLLTSAVLERDGYSVELADSSAAALSAIRASRPDLILMDIQLAGEDGLDLTRRIKSDSATASIPIVALTAHAMAGDSQEAIAAGCNGYITKPIDTRRFVEQVKLFLRSVADRAESTKQSSPGGNRR